MPDDVATGGSNASRQKKPRKNLANACKVHRCIQVSPERESVRGFFLSDQDAASPGRFESS
jgi:hypothetical protein